MSISVGAVSSAQTYASLFQSHAPGGGDPSATDPLTALLQLGSASVDQANAVSNSLQAGSGSCARFSAGAMASLLSAQSQQSGAPASGAGDPNDNSAGAQSATTTITTNPDGSITTTTSYADGSVTTATTPAPSSPASGSPQTNATGGQSGADQLLKMVSNGIQALAPAAALLAVI